MGKSKGDVFSRRQKQADAGPPCPPSQHQKGRARGKRRKKDAGSMEKRMKMPAPAGQMETGPVPRAGTEQIHHCSGRGPGKKGQGGPVLRPFSQGEGAGRALAEFFYCSSLALTR